VDVRLSAEQVALRDSAAQVVDRLGPRVVADLADTERIAKLDAAVTASGWRELRTASDEGGPWASAVEVAVVAEELGRGLADVSFIGPTLAADLRRLSGAGPATTPETMVLTEDLSEPARAGDRRLGEPGLAIDAAGATSALTLLSRGPGTVADGWGVGSLAFTDPKSAEGVDLTRRAIVCAAESSVAPLPAPGRGLAPDDLVHWHSLGLAVACADLVGVMRGAVALAADYAKTRTQYGATIGSFQAVQHLLADAQVAMEGSRSIALHAAWAVDALSAPEALAVASSAKAYCARAARNVCETAIQVHGGIGNTWECLAHVFLRRALLSTELLGGIGVSLDRVLASRGIGGDDGLR
jgi:alkylation response protein AidB-like acyl-CoA dehydrogenase